MPETRDGNLYYVIDDKIYITIIKIIVPSVQLGTQLQVLFTNKLLVVLNIYIYIYMLIWKMAWISV